MLEYGVGSPALGGQGLSGERAQARDGGRIGLDRALIEGREVAPGSLRRGLEQRRRAPRSIR